jgi:hypothetical protein
MIQIPTCQKKEKEGNGGVIEYVCPSLRRLKKAQGQGQQDSERYRDVHI